MDMGILEWSLPHRQSCPSLLAPLTWSHRRRWGWGADPKAPPAASTTLPDEDPHASSPKTTEAAAATPAAKDVQPSPVAASSPNPAVTKATDDSVRP